MSKIYLTEAKHVRDFAKTLPPDAKEANLCLKRAAEYEALAANAKATADRIRAEAANQGTSKK